MLKSHLMVQLRSPVLRAIQLNMHPRNRCHHQVTRCHLTLKWSCSLVESLIKNSPATFDIHCHPFKPSRLHSVALILNLRANDLHIFSLPPDRLAPFPPSAATLSPFFRFSEFNQLNEPINYLLLLLLLSSPSPPLPRSFCFSLHWCSLFALSRGDFISS